MLASRSRTTKPTWNTDRTGISPSSTGAAGLGWIVRMCGQRVYGDGHVKSRDPFERRVEQRARGVEDGLNARDDGPLERGSRRDPDVRRGPPPHRRGQLSQVPFVEPGCK